ncbi:MAG: oxaloacetate decarboxylase [Eubacteriales bacterium]|nr:oxaloacetate decarboxylase [Eubacteriales bacterium]
MKKWTAVLAGLAGAALVIAGIIMKIRKMASIAIIGGADGPTSVFLAGKVGGGFSISVIAVGIVLLLIVIWMCRKK